MDRRNSGFSSLWRRFTIVLLLLLLVFSLCIFTGCGGGSGDETDGESAGSDAAPDSNSDADSDSDSDSDTSTDTDSSWVSVDLSDLEDDYDEDDYTWSASAVTQITLSDGGITGATSGASAAGSVLTISSAGTYSITGSLSDGRIIVDTGDEEVVRLIFNGVDIDCDDSAPLYVANAGRTIIILADGADNSLSDHGDYTYFDDTENEVPNATLFSKDYLTIGAPDGGAGTGTLTVSGHYNDGITGKDGLIIDGGTVTVSAPDDGIRGKDYLLVKSGTLDITTTDTGDGLLSDNDAKAEKGYILIENGDITVNAQEDAIQAETYVWIWDGEFDLTSGGGASNEMAVDDDSMKGVKGGAGVLIEGGDFTRIDAADDAIHSNDFIVVEAGTFDIASGDDGLHADLLVTIYDGDFSITESYEGIEGAVITIEDGNFYIVSDDDGLNCAGGNDGSGFTGGRDGGMPSSDSGDYAMYLNGGYLAVYAQGDGLDSNGSIEMTGGTVLIHGPTGSGNGSLDCGDQGGEILIDGGLLVAAGSSAMVESPDSSSEQRFKTLRFSSEKAAGTLFHIENSSGTDIVTFEPSKRYQSMIISTPDLETGTTYDVYFGGSYIGGEGNDGLYEGGTYSGGSIEEDLNFSL